MTKHRLFELTLVLVIMGVSFWNVKQQQETVSLKEAIVALDEDKKELQVKKEELINENDQLTKQIVASSKTLKEFQNQNSSVKVDTDVNTEFINIITKLFEANLNFTPENYKDKKQEVSGYLSDELKKEYFGQKRRTYQDLNNTFSRIESLEVYPRAVGNNELDGLVVAQYKSKKNNRDWVKGNNIFKISYAVDSKKIIRISNLGSNYTEK